MSQFVMWKGHDQIGSRPLMEEAGHADCGMAFPLKPMEIMEFIRLAD
jgi:hypothetical protein